MKKTSYTTASMASRWSRRWHASLSRGVPRSNRALNGPEFISKALDHWAYENGVTLDFSRPSKPIDNAFVEAFNSRLRDKCSTPTGSCSWMMPRPRSRPGGGTITRADLTHPLAGCCRSEYAAAPATQAAECTPDTHPQPG